ncbi:MAG TPA: hypothetical protein EYN66_14735 [Myxococcales bacterium]|nr:hypothetical protein [Myxococcales bacterium]
MPNVSFAWFQCFSVLSRSRRFIIDLGILLLMSLLAAFMLAGCDAQQNQGEDSLSLLIDTTTFVEQGAPSGSLLLTILGNQPTVAMVSGDGEVIWSIIDDSHPNSNAAITHARLQGDVLYYIYYTPESQVTEVDDFHLLVTVDLLTGARHERTLAGFHHDFALLPDGGVGYLANDWRKIHGAFVSGDYISEMDKEGRITVIWSAWDQIPFDAALIKQDTLDWTHANVLDYDSENDEYSIGLRNMNAIVRVDRTTKETIRTFAEPQFTMTGVGQFQVWQHRFRWISPNRLLLFDNGEAERQASRAVEYEINWSENTAQQVWSHYSDPISYTYLLGDVERLASGDTLICWGDQGRIDLVTPDGEVTWTLQVDGKLGYFEWFPN